jgi:hypothetical protein
MAQNAMVTATHWMAVLTRDKEKALSASIPATVKK